MKLEQCIAGLGLSQSAGPAALPVADLTDDSRCARPGSVFLARAGAKSDGSAFIRDALSRGASAIIATQSPGQLGIDLPAAVAWVQGSHLDQAFASRLAEQFFGHPSQKLKLVGITGTKGKTTTAFLVQHLLAQAGMACGMIGTVVIDDGASRRPAELTTPGAIDFSRHLAAMVANGCQAAVAEVSSHALDQGRTAALDFDAAIFTNLTGDHLDYHQTMDAYAVAKARLFSRLKPQAVAVINLDDAYAQVMLDACPLPDNVLTCRVVEAGTNPGQAHCRAVVRSLEGRSSTADFHGPWRDITVRLPLVGKHNLANALQAAAAAFALAPVPAGQLIQALQSSPDVPGRLERVLPPGNPGATAGEASGGGPTVLVDYAHTHDSLEKVLQALRPLTAGKLICLFGCGGDRDRTKRPKMARIACALADQVIVTSDNPRTEYPLAIINEVLAGVPADAKGRVQVEPDRAQAIAAAIAAADDHDLVLLAGKGHEDYQIIGHEKRHFDDREHAAAALAKRRPPAASRACSESAASAVSPPKNRGGTR